MNARSDIFLIVWINISRSIVENFMMIINEPLAIVTTLSKHVIDKESFKRFWAMVVTIFSYNLGVGFSGNPLEVL
jgi:hypothetical protein